MNERKKLEEAKYFYSRMIEEEENRGVFRYYLSAFLSAARSVMQYALNEAEEKTGGKKWYDDWMTANPVLSFFRAKRDFNIHTAPHDPRKHVNVHVTDVVRISDSVNIKVIGKDGKVKEEMEIKEEPKPIDVPKSSVKVESSYEFDDWQGDEDLITLCSMYIQELEKVVGEGVEKGFITG